MSHSTKKITTEEFIVRAKVVHGNKYDYRKTVYTKAIEGTIVICSIHGDFSVSARKHINGQGCPKCSNMFRPTTEEFIEKAELVHNKAYTYSKTIYTNANGKVCITCPIHGDWEQRAAHHISGRGCPSCAEYGFNHSKPAILYYLKITTDDNRVFYKIGITNRTVNERFNLTDLSKIEILKQKTYDTGSEALEWETKLKQLYHQYQYKGPKILKDGNTEVFTEDVIAMWHNKNSTRFGIS